MPWYYSYSPVHGYCTSDVGNNNYCSGGSHPTVLSPFYNRADLILASPCPQRIDFVGSSNVLSIRTTRSYNVICGGSCGGGISDRLLIELFRVAVPSPSLSDRIGQIVIGHVNSIVANDVYYTYASAGKRRVDQLGWVARGVCSSDNGSCAGADFPSGCYTAMHPHMEAYGHAGYNPAMQNCSSYPYLVPGTTWMYEFFKA